MGPGFNNCLLGKVVMALAWAWVLVLVSSFTKKFLCKDKALSGELSCTRTCFVLICRRFHCFFQHNCSSIKDKYGCIKLYVFISQYYHRSNDVSEIMDTPTAAEQ